MLFFTLLLAATDPGQALLDEARPLIGQPYDLGGRLQAGRGTDCQGIVFYAAERVQRCSWKSFSVMPTTTVSAEEFGRPVRGASPVRIGELDVSLLKPGDVLLFLNTTVNPAEPALTMLDEDPVWVWHMGLYAGEGRVLHADPFANAVVEEDLRTLLAHHGSWVQGVTALRLDGPPKPRVCRRGARMPNVASPAAP
jgi:cell wall-associated NlpC family hydrolase